MDIEKYAKTGDFESHGGLILAKYYDCVKLFFDDSLFPTKFIEDLITRINYIEKPINLIGIETFGMNLTIFLMGHLSGLTTSWKRYINHLFFLKERKNRDRLYGEIIPNRRTFLLDDIITTGKTILDALEFLGLREIRIDGIICIKNRSNYKYLDNIPIHDLSKK
jgi:orotate phosphoribosyltransferase